MPHPETEPLSRRAGEPCERHAVVAGGPSRIGPDGYHHQMIDPASASADTRSYSPGLEGVIAGETALSFIDGEAGDRKSVV